MFTNYFFMKVGNGNILLRHALQASQGGEPAFLWVGYGSEGVPTMDPSAGNAGRSAPLDLRYLARASWDDEARSSVRILTFQEDSLYIWRPTDRVRPITEQELDALVATFGTDKAAYDRLELSWKQRNAGVLRAYLNCKALPVRLERRVERVLLPACIDSLSVYQSLNRGTFRFLGPTNPKLLTPGLLPRLLAPEPVPLRLPGEQSWTETPFACFVRKYLDWCLDASMPESFASVYGLDPADAALLATATMSPSQLEVAASMLVQALGMTLDAGVGKGLDVIDVRASVRHHIYEPNYPARLASLKNRLAQLMGTPVDLPVLRALDSTGTLVIQCKNFVQSTDSQPHPHLVFFTPTGPPGGRCITMASVRSFLEEHPGVLPALEDWLCLVQFSYTQEKATLGWA